MSESLRIDKWLWFARFFKTRALAAEMAINGRVRVNDQRCSKASYAVKAGDVLTFPQGRAVRVIRVVALGERRGPAVEARTLYEDLDPPKETEMPPPDSHEGGAVQRLRSSGRPTKKDRRAVDRLKDTDE